MKAISLIKYFSLLIIMLSSYMVKGQVVVNEIMAANESTFPDNHGEFNDWIELYNKGNEDVHLLGWYLSDKTDNATRWCVPDIWIRPEGHLLIIASGKDEFDGIYWHTNFKLDKEGEAVVLTFLNGTTSDLINFPPLSDDQSYGRLPDGADAFAFFQHPTPLGTNQADSSSPTLKVNLNFSTSPGLYTGTVEIDIIADRTDVEIHYTLDGRDPEMEDAVVEGPISLSSADLPVPKLAYLPSSNDWEPPDGEVMTHHVIRARPFQQGHAVGKVITGTYFFYENYPYTMPVVSITTPPDSLFDPARGIYHAGAGENYFNRGQDWERPAHFEYFNEQGKLQLQQAIGIRVSGFTTRAYPQKIIKLYARSEYGASHFEYAFFGQQYDAKFKRLALRTISGDWSQMGFSDDLCHQLILGQTTADHARRRFVVVLINGEY